MEELRKCYAELSARLRSIENDHETDILDFINLDEEIMNDFRGDWTDDDVHKWLYFVDRMSAVTKAYNIVREELHLGEMLPGEGKKIWNQKE